MFPRFALPRKEEFMRTAQVVNIGEICTGITKPKRVTISRGDKQLNHPQRRLYASCRVISLNSKAADAAVTKVSNARALQV